MTPQDSIGGGVEYACPDPTQICPTTLSTPPRIIGDKTKAPSVSKVSGVVPRLASFLFICAGLRFVWVSLILVDLPPRDAAAAAEEERCGDEGFDY